MDNWIKIETFDRLHQAELRKQILESCEIPAVIINERDSLFLVGDIELYVRETDEKKAKAMIDEFTGLTKINSFIDLRPIEEFRTILTDAGIQTTLKRKEHSRFVKDNYELFVKNEDLNRVLPYLTGEKLDGRLKLLTCRKVRQTKFYVDLLAESLINTIIIKKKDSEYHLSEIYIYVSDNQYDKASELVTGLHGWEVIRHSEVYSDIEVLEETLALNALKSLIKREDSSFSLLVQDFEFGRADELLNLHAKWETVLEFPSVADAEYYKEVLESQNIPAVIVNEKDSSFMLGNIELVVEERHRDTAKKLIQELQTVEQ